jgi:hypothetical protein
MRFDEMLAVRQQAAKVTPPVEYPKYIHVDGKSVLVMDAKHEAELIGDLGIDVEADEGGKPASEPIENLLSNPPARRGRPPKAKPVLVHSNPKD